MSDLRRRSLFGLYLCSVRLIPVFVVLLFGDVCLADDVSALGPEWPRQEQLAVEPSPFRFNTARKQTFVAPVNGNANLNLWRVGDRVKRGDVLVRLPVERMNVEFRRAIGNYHQAYLKMQEQASQNSDSIQNSDRSEILQLTFQAAENELKSLADRIRRQVLVAEYDGIIEQIFVLEEELVRAGQPLMRISDSGFLKVQLPVDARTVTLGQKVSFFCASGRGEVILVHVDSQARQFGRFKEVMTDLVDGTFVYDNRAGAVSVGELVGLPQYPFALFPAEFVRQLSPTQPEVWMQNSGLEQIKIPVEIIGSVGPQDFVLAGPFRSDEVPVKIISPATAETPAVSEPITQAVLFPRSQPLLNNEQLEAKFPALADRIPSLPVSSTVVEQNLPEQTWQLDLPQELQGLLRSEDYPLAEATVDELLSTFGLSAAEKPILEIVIDYFRAEAVRKRLIIRSPNEIKQSSTTRSLAEYLDQVHKLNDEIVTLLLIFLNENDQQAVFQRRYQLQAMALLTGSWMQNYLQLTESQQNQLQQMEQAYLAQRQQLYDQYQQEKMSLAELRSTSDQTHQAFKADLQILLNAEQKQIWAKLNAIPTASTETPADQANSASSTVPTEKSSTTNETTEDEENEEGQPSRRSVLPPALQQQPESALTPFLYLGGGVFVLLILLGGGWFFYRSRKSR